MPKIPNWSKTLDRAVGDVLGLSGEIAEWEHDETGDTVTVVKNEDGYGDNNTYEIRHNGADVTARDTLADATDVVKQTLRNKPDGL